MTPDFKILAAGVDVTPIIAKYLIQLSVKDDAGIKADEVSIKLDDRDGTLILPPVGTPLTIYMGYVETGLVPMGVYTADDITLTGPQQTMHIRGKAANMGGTLKDQKSREWSEKTISDIVEAIAGEHGLTPKIAAGFGSFLYKGISQTAESDISFLNRIAKDHDALVSVKNDTLLFMGKGLGESASGKSLSIMQILRADVSSWSVTMAERGKYKSVKASWQNEATGKKETVTAGAGSPIQILRNSFASEPEATRAAQAKIEESTRGNNKLDLTMVGNPIIAAEAQIALIDFREGVKGRWAIASVNHTIGGNGYQTKIQAETPKSSSK